MKPSFSSMLCALIKFSKRRALSNFKSKNPLKMQMPFSSTMSRNPSATILALSNTSTSSSALHSQITKPNKTQIWNIQMRELAKQGLYQQGINLCRQMLRSGTTPNASSFPFPLKSCTILSLPLLGKQIHGQTVKMGLEHHPLVLTSLVSMYSKWYEIGSASKVFGKSPLWVRDTICYNSLLAGYSYNSMFCETVSLFCEMRGAGVSLNSVTMLGLIPVFTQPEHLCFGMSVHGCSVKFGLDYDMSVANCLLSMYVRCGSVELARKLFDGMSDKGLITWNAMISGYAQNGLANEVLDLYREMKVCGVCPDEVTLLGVLSSCAHLGAQSIGREVEERMALGGFGSNPFLQNSLINMYARCGNLLKARALFDDMPAKSIITWTAIIGERINGCQKQLLGQLADDQHLLAELNHGASKKVYKATNKAAN
ncbi:Pentatricopeptide repeat [Dillenia turbinata]|uniref:Pentatricopeptide repeat n=1 Tax=Dillenia turbinata TaxID=194707 RepID=A0AAN8ZIL1_9MAGN